MHGIVSQLVISNPLMVTIVQEFNGTDLRSDQKRIKCDGKVGIAMSYRQKLLPFDYGMGVR